ncbi:MAG: butyrate kinase [Oscillospiraceae bacterium]|nr:butyrate kinase [Oscillospiraceae bacterium]
MDKKIRILAINPGSTTTKIGLFDDLDLLFETSIAHSATDLKKFPTVQSQLNFRIGTVEKTMSEHGYAMADVDVYSARGGGLASVEGGVYEVTELLVQHASSGISGTDHPAQLGSQIARNFGITYGKPAYIVNPPDTDEFVDVARITGLKGIYRESHLHALNQKETALRFCQEHGLNYEDVNLIICHTGGGISITAHREGRMIDSNDILMGSGPMSPNRAGDMPYLKIIELAYSGKYSQEELSSKLNESGGLMDHFGTSDFEEICALTLKGDSIARTVLDGMVYQNAKYVGAMAVALRGKVDTIILTGGIAKNETFVRKLTSYISWISKIVVMPGEHELEALAAGALRVLRGELTAKKYSGIPVWSGF